MSVRYAIYFAPAPQSRLGRLGAQTLGYDADTGRDVAPEVEPAFPDETWRGWTAEPRRYGFHATLKAPFEPKAGLGEPDVIAAARDLAARLAPVALPRLRVAAIGRFVALAPEEEAPGLATLARRCVEALEPLRAPLAQADRARRKEAGLTARQAQYLERYGYPYVLEEFRFHMTLAGPLAPGATEPVRTFLAERFRHVSTGIAMDALAIFRQEDRSARFRCLARLPLVGAADV